MHQYSWIRTFGELINPIFTLAFAQPPQIPQSLESCGIIKTTSTVLTVLVPNVLCWLEIRHECRIEDHLTNWGWVQHDGQQYGVQTIHDQEANVKLTFKMIKSSNELGWNTRIYVDPIDSTRHFHIKLIIYVSYDTLPGKFVREIDDDQVQLVT